MIGDGEHVERLRSAREDELDARDREDRYAEKGEVVYRVTTEMQFVPPGATAHLEDGRAVEGPCFLEAPPRVTLRNWRDPA